MNSAIILAAGNSKRLGREKPKQYMEINGRLIIDFSISIFDSCDLIDEIVVVVASEYVDKIKKKYPDFTVVQGGKSRKKSSFLGLMACSKETKNVLIHDAARIFINTSLITSCIDALSICDAVTFAFPMTDTIAKYSDNRIIKMENRDKLISIQTPQGFNYKKLVESHKKFIGKASDDIRIMLENGYRCNFLKGLKENFKITTELSLVNLTTSEISVSKINLRVIFFS